MVVLFYTRLSSDISQGRDVLESSDFFYSLQILIDIESMEWARDREKKCFRAHEFSDFCHHFFCFFGGISRAKASEKRIECLTFYICEVDPTFCFTREKYLSDPRKSSSRFESDNEKIIVFFSFLERSRKIFSTYRSDRDIETETHEN